MLSHIASSGRLLSVQRTRNFNVAALERYRIIRNFFRNQHTVAPETSRCLAKPPKFTKRLGDQENGLIYNQRRYFHPSVLRPFATSQCSENSPQTHDEAARSRDSSKSQSQDYPSSNQEPNAPPTRNDENYSRFFQRLALSLPHLHRPTRDDFLKVATGFWQRMRIRFKWFTIKSFRKFNADDISAFITWFVMSQTLWILIGT
jgi:mitochondrial distribution and morphology protein 31